MTLMRAAEPPSHLRHVRAHTPCRQEGAKGEPCRPYIWSPLTAVCSMPLCSGPLAISAIPRYVLIYELTCKARSSPYIFDIGYHIRFCNVVSLSGDPRNRTMHRRFVPLMGKRSLGSCFQSICAMNMCPALLRWTARTLF